MNKDKIETSADIVGFVFPTYISTVPAPVGEFFRKLDLKSSTYVFSVATRMGTLCLSNLYIERVLKRKGKTLDSFFIINMANNSPTGIKPIGDKEWVNKINKEEIERLEYEVQRKVDFIKDYVIGKRKYAEEKVSFYKRSLEIIMTSVIKNLHKEIPFYADIDCNNCGICEKVCLSKKIEIIDRKPVWKEGVQCYFCYACFNFCPRQSILIKKLYTQKNERYSHPEINAIDIM